MADLLNPDTSHERNTLRNLLLSAAVLVVLAAAAFAIFYHHEDHAPVELTSLQSLALSLHTTYTHKGKVAEGPEGSDDTTYVVAALHVLNRTGVPVFIKDITGALQISDGTATQFTRIKVGDVDRLLQIVPTLKPVLHQIGVAPLQPEQTIAPNAAVDGYVLLQLNGPRTVWDTRKTASLTLDYYHQDSQTVTLK